MMLRRLSTFFLLMTLVIASEPAANPDDLRAAKIRNFFKSLILPGWGQISEGHYIRAGSFIAAEIAAISGYRILYTDGEQMEADYKDYADEHWSFLAWIANGTDPDGDVACNGRFIRTHEMPYSVIDGTPLPYRDHHYYENIGKYPEFICGWDDFSQSYITPTDWEYTPNMYEYVQMRSSSNKSYRQSRVALQLLMANHILSALEAAAGTSVTTFKGANMSGLVYINPVLSGPSINLEVRF